MQFPCFMYHQEQGPHVFQSAEDLAAAGEGWVDTPAKFDPKYVEPPPLPEDAPGVNSAAPPGYVPQRYPTLVYRQGDPDHPRRVEGAEDLAALEAAEPGVWGESPDPKAKCWSGIPAEPNPEPSPAHDVALSPDQVTDFQGSTVSVIIERLATVTNPGLLDALQGAEEANPKGKRVTVIKAIDARRAELRAPAA